MRKQLKRGQFTLTEKQIKKLFTGALRHRDRVVLKLLALCGLRRDEVRNIKIQDIDFEKERLTVVGKFRVERVVPVPGELIQDIKFLIGNTRPEWLFRSTRKHGEPISLKTINCIVADAGRVSKVSNPDRSRKNLNPHLLRHSFARLLKDKGMPLEVIQNLLGHKHFSTTMDQYGLLSIEEIHDRFRSVFES